MILTKEQEAILNGEQGETLAKVMKKIFRSNKNETFAAYQQFSSIRLCHSTPFLPFTCAQPEIPGRTSCLRICSGV